MPPASTRPDATPGAKMLYLIKRKPTTSREELVVHWFGNHMSGVIEGQQDLKAAGKAHAWRYIATLFDADASGRHPWDGVAQLWWDFALGRPKRPLGTVPKDTFQQKAEPHTSWATTEYVALDGAAQLAAEPLTLNPPYPTTRSGFHKQTMLVKARDGVDFEAMFAHWLDVHRRTCARRCCAWVGSATSSASASTRRSSRTPGWRSCTSRTTPAGRAFASRPGRTASSSGSTPTGRWRCRRARR